VSTYVDPAERVAAVSSKAQADDIKTWTISEVDKKGKKKKGTLGVGNGAVFFASESDKVCICPVGFSSPACNPSSHRRPFGNGRLRPSRASD